MNSLTHLQYFAVGIGLSSIVGDRAIRLNRAIRVLMMCASLALFFIANFYFDA